MVKYLYWQVDKHAEQLQDATQDLIEAAIKTHNVTILAFPDHHNHHHVEEKVFQVNDESIWLKSDLYLRYHIEDLITPDYWSCSVLKILTNQWVTLMRLKAG